MKRFTSITTISIFLFTILLTGFVHADEEYTGPSVGDFIYKFPVTFWELDPWSSKKQMVYNSKKKIKMIAIPLFSFGDEEDVDTTGTMPEKYFTAEYMQNTTMQEMKKEQREYIEMRKRGHSDLSGMYGSSGTRAEISIITYSIIDATGSRINITEMLISKMIRGSDTDGIKCVGFWPTMKSAGMETKFANFCRGYSIR